MGSQWSSRNTGEIWSLRRVPVIGHAVSICFHSSFWTNWPSTSTSCRYSVHDCSSSETDRQNYTSRSRVRVSGNTVVLQLSSIRGLTTPWTYFLHLSLSSVILIDSSTGSPVHVLILSIQAVHGLPRLRAPGISNTVNWSSAHRAHSSKRTAAVCGDQTMGRRQRYRRPTVTYTLLRIEGTVRHCQSKEASILWSHHKETR